MTPPAIHLLRRVLPLASPFTCGELEGSGTDVSRLADVTCANCRFVLEVEQRASDLRLSRVYSRDARVAAERGDVDDATYFARTSARYGLRVFA